MIRGSLRAFADLAYDLPVAEVVYVLGAGFSRSVVDPRHDQQAPLANDFFNLLLTTERYSGDPQYDLDGFRGSVHVDVLLDEIARYWHLDLEQLKTEPLDVEECLTLFESRAADTEDRDESLRMRRASFALRQMLLSYLSNLRPSSEPPSAARFAQDVLERDADVLTFNYDTLAETAIASASELNPKDRPGPPWKSGLEVDDSDLDASFRMWRPALGLGIEFDELNLPINGPPPLINGKRYYAHPRNRLYRSTRVLKLHGSIDWLRYTHQRLYPGEEPSASASAKKGLVLQTYPSYFFGETPTWNRWKMEPVIEPPILYKRLDRSPFDQLWGEALETLGECQELIIVGYSFPATDFRTKRLFLEAFSDHSPARVTVVNPDSDVAAVVQRLTHFTGSVTTADSLSALYGLPASVWPDDEGSVGPSAPPGETAQPPGADSSS